MVNKIIKVFGWQYVKKRGLAKRVAKRRQATWDDCFALSFWVTFFD